MVASKLGVDQLGGRNTLNTFCSLMELGDDPATSQADSAEVLQPLPHQAWHPRSVTELRHAKPQIFRCAMVCHTGRISFNHDLVSMTYAGPYHKTTNGKTKGIAEINGLPTNLQSSSSRKSLRPSALEATSGRKESDAFESCDHFCRAPYKSDV